MNHLEVRKGPELNFIIEEHQQEFINHVFELYEETEHGILVSATEDIAMFTAARFTLAGVLNYYGDDSQLFSTETKGMTREEIDFWSTINLSTLGEQMVLTDSLDALADDVVTILDYYNMCFMVEFGLDLSSGSIIYEVRNLPIVEVW